MNADFVTLICLFHKLGEAEAARADVLAAGVPDSDLSLITAAEPGSTASLSMLNELDLPARDLHHLLNRLEHGDVALAVRAAEDLESRVDAIFAYHQADLVAESGTEEQHDAPPPIGPVSAGAERMDRGGTVLPVLHEELHLGKRTVANGVRVFQRVVKVPVAQQVSLRDENVRVERNSVDRAATAEESALGGEQVIELTETREQLVIGKSARVVEEIVVGREVSQRVEHITDTLRHTEVEVQQIAPEKGGTRGDRTTTPGRAAGEHSSTL